jgi:hypothetical protein
MTGPWHQRRVWRRRLGPGPREGLGQAEYDRGQRRNARSRLPENVSARTMMPNRMIVHNSSGSALMFRDTSIDAWLRRVEGGRFHFKA